MRKEVIVSAKTVDEAAAQGAQMLGVDVADVTFEVLTQPKKGFIGMGAVDAKLKVVYEVSTAQCAVNFVKQVISDMELSVDVDFTVDQKDVMISLSGKDVGTLIGHHGETLDALQYLANLAANKKEEGQDREYMKISVDAENYRAKREETLRRLARRIAEKVVKYGKSVKLEPMPAHERRIIHAEIQDIENVSTNSIGVDTNRRVLVFPVGIEPKPSRPAKKRSVSKVHNYGVPTRYEDLQVEEESDGISLPKTALHPIGENFEKRKSVADYFGDNEEDYQIEEDFSELENTIDTGSIASSSAPSKYHNEFSIYDLDFKFKSNRGDKQ